jgi:hypothetical protein
MAKPTVLVDKVYKLLINAPLSYTIASRNNPRFPLMWFDEEKQINRVLRYATNQNSPFEDEQDGTAILEPVVFEDGFLSVPKTNVALQKFLHFHPHNGTLFAELDKEKDASEEVRDMNIEVDALIEARSLDISQIEMISRVLFGRDPSAVSTAELKRDILVFARRYPQDFLDVINDPELKFHAKVRTFFENGWIGIRGNNKELWYNTATNKKKMCLIPFNSDPFDTALAFLTSDEGIDGLKMLDMLLES